MLGGEGLSYKKDDLRKLHDIGIVVEELIEITRCLNNTEPCHKNKDEKEK